MRTDPTLSYFRLPDRLENPDIDAEISEDQKHLHRVARLVSEQRRDVAERLVRRGQDRAGILQQSLERDVELARLARRLRALDRMGPEACLGFMVNATTGQRTYVGRIGLTDENSEQLLVDWRAPAAEPFFAATHACPHNLRIRRRYRWRLGKIVNFWDEVFDLSQLSKSSSLDEHSSFLASLGTNRVGKMQDVLSTIQSDQDSIIRSSAKGALVVDGGPGTGKTVVALHRAAYLLHADAQLHSGGGRVLVLGPHEAYTAYISDILPNLGEEDVLIATLNNLVPEVSGSAFESSTPVARLKSTHRMVDAVRRAVTVFEQPPGHDLLIETSWGDLKLTMQHWANALASVDPGTDHNESRSQIRQVLEEILIEQLPNDCAPLAQIHAEITGNTLLTNALEVHWPLLDPHKLITAMFSIPALLRFSAPWLSDSEQQSLLLEQTHTLTVEDGPLLDAARFFVGDPEVEFAKHRRDSILTAEREIMQRVIGELIAGADDMEDLSSQLRNEDLQEKLVLQRAEAELPTDSLTGPFAHIIIDEAQDLTEAQWTMVLRRCPSGSLTIVGDRAQAANGFTESWEERLVRVGISRCRVATLGVNYRTTQQIMDAAASVIRQHLPDANVPSSIRTDGAPVIYAKPIQQADLLAKWLSENPLGVGAVIGDPLFTQTERIRSLSPAQSKGLEFDLVILNRPENFGHSIAGSVHRYVSMTRATGQLMVLSDEPF